MTHFSKPNLAQRIALSGNSCPTCKKNGNGSGMLIRQVSENQELTRDVKCNDCGDSFTKPSQSLR
ncbi:hypothetical protein OTK49_21320 [Vibrio coralliirubri]|uniref:hypothetical protein n=1 Tax=Vibrio coralliirubri TaxID=1516159 RepID=UPI0022847DB9|nr:hypothetical protein [Vibrio coralliirubri]MCY9865062.1 hypothetical protein [Vibrio coralliirubri]